MAATKAATSSRQEPPLTALNARQRRFVEEYLVDLNATQAAIRAGYSARTAEACASRLLRVVKVSTAIATAQAARSRRVEVTQDYVLENLTEVTERCMQRAAVLEFDRDSKTWVQATDEDGNGIWQFDARGAVGALTLLAKHTGGFIDRTDHTSGGKPIGAITWNVVQPVPGTSPRRLDAILAAGDNRNGSNGHNGSG